MLFRVETLFSSPTRMQSLIICLKVSIITSILSLGE